MEDSLIAEEVPTTPQRPSDKRSSILHDTPSFLVKRRDLTESLLDDNSEFSLSLNVSALNQSGLAQGLPSGKEVSFHSCSSIVENGSSLLGDVGTVVNFNDISLSGINESDSVVAPTPSVVVDANPASAMGDVNPADMSYESLLRWEQAQGGVLDEKWKKVRESVMAVCAMEEGMRNRRWMCVW